MCRFNETISLVVDCDTRVEIDRHCEELTHGGQPIPCGSLKDRFSLTWQVVPRDLPNWLSDADPARV